MTCNIEPGTPIHEPCKTCGHLVAIHSWPLADCEVCKLREYIDRRFDEVLRLLERMP